LKVRRFTHSAKELGIGLMLMLVSSALILLLSEGAIRTFVPQQLILVRPDVWQPVDVLGWKFRPDVQTSINTGERTVTLRTDARGYRIGNAVPESPTRQVLLLGDSFMAAVQVEYEETVAGLMERELARALGESVRVLNTGVGGWDTPHYLLKAERLLVEERMPVDAVVIAVYLGNDIVSERIESYPSRTPVQRWSFRLPRSFNRSELIDSLARPTDDVLKRQSHLYILVKNRFDHLRTRLGLTEAYFPSVYLQTSLQSRRWTVTADILQDIASMAEEEGIGTLIVLIPSHFQVHTDALETHLEAFGIDRDSVVMDQPNVILGSELRRRGLVVVDTLEALRKAAASGQQTFGKIDTHLAPAGHAVVWETIEEKVREKMQYRPPL
jgi:hypothetical protein